MHFIDKYVNDPKDKKVAINDKILKNQMKGVIMKTQKWIMTNLTIIILISVSGIQIGCKKDNTTPLISGITAQPSNLSYGDTTILTVSATDSDKDDLTYQWNCSTGRFVGTTSSSTVRWVAPYKSGTFGVDVTVSDDQHNVTSNAELLVLGLFYDGFSTNLDKWRRSYCDAWISSEEAHLEGNRSGYYGTLYRYFSSAVEPEYTCQMRIARVDNFSANEHYALYTRVADMGSTKVIDLMFIIYPSLTEINWEIYALVVISGYGKWVPLDNDSFGYSPFINTGPNEWNDISWKVESDKTIVVRVNDQLLHHSNGISQLEEKYNITITMDLVRFGARTFPDKEIKFDDALVTVSSEKSYSSQRFEDNDQKMESKDIDNTMDIPVFTQHGTSLPVLRETLKKRTN